MVNIQKNLTLIAFLFFVMALTVVMCGKVPIKKRDFKRNGLSDGNVAFTKTSDLLDLVHEIVAQLSRSVLSSCDHSLLIFKNSVSNPELDRLKTKLDQSLVVMEGDGGRDVKDQKLKQNKRTFCNAFTGCQGKRSDSSSPPMKDYDYPHESGKEAMDENSIDDAARDILAEARMWEAFQSRNSMRYPLVRRQGFFGREKRATHADDDSFERLTPKDQLKTHE